MLWLYPWSGHAAAWMKGDFAFAYSTCIHIYICRRTVALANSYLALGKTLEDESRQAADNNWDYVLIDKIGCCVICWLHFVDTRGGMIDLSGVGVCGCNKGTGFSLYFRSWSFSLCFFLPCYVAPHCTSTLVVHVPWFRFLYDLNHSGRGVTKFTQHLGAWVFPQVGAVLYFLAGILDWMYSPSAEDDKLLDPCVIGRAC